MKMARSVLVRLLLLIISSQDFIALSKALDHNFWRSIPGDIRVLEHTKASFNWTHTIEDPVDIEWTYNTGSESTHGEIMSFKNRIIERSDTRAGYYAFEGSASMYIENTTVDDEGEYGVNIGRLGAGKIIGSGIAQMSVISAAKVKLRVTIDGEVFDLSVADYGSDITLPEGSVIFLSSPTITVEVAEFVPTPLSIKTTYSIQENENVPMCERCRKLSFSWFNDIDIKVSFDIQNLEAIYIRKHIRHQVPWRSIPGKIRALSDTDVLFNWTHNISGPVNLVWKYRTSRSEPNEVIMRCNNDDITTPKYMSSRLEYVDIDRSAAIKLKSVRASDGGLYEATILEPNSAAAHNISDVAELLVIDKSTLEYSVTVDKHTFSLSYITNGTDVTLPMAEVTVPSQHQVTVRITASDLTANLITIVNEADQTERRCQRTNQCTRRFNFVLKLAANQQLKISINIFYGILNLKAFSLQYTLILSTAYDITTNRNMAIWDYTEIRNWKIATFVGYAVIALFIASWVIFLRHRCSKRHSRAQHKETDSKQMQPLTKGRGKHGHRSRENPTNKTQDRRTPSISSNREMMSDRLWIVDSS